MDKKLLFGLKNVKKILFGSQKGNYYNILVLGRTVLQSTLINVVLDLKGDKAAKENAVKPEIGVNYYLPNSNNKEIIITGKNKFIPIENISDKSSLVLLDSKSIEISKDYNFDVGAEDIFNSLEREMI